MIDEETRRQYSANPEDVALKIFERKEEELTIDHLLEFPYVDFRGVNKVRRSRHREGIKQDMIRILSKEEEESYTKWLKSMPSEDEITSLVHRHLAPLELDSSYMVELGKPKLTGTMFEQSRSRAFKRWAESEGLSTDELTAKLKSEDPGHDYFERRLKEYLEPELYFPAQFDVDAKISKKIGLGVGIVQEMIMIEIAKIAGEDSEGYDIKWQARSYFKSRAWLDAKLGNNKIYYLIVGVRSKEEAKYLYDHFFEDSSVACIHGMSQDQMGQLEGAATMEAMRCEDFEMVDVNSEEYKQQEREREQRLRDPKFPDYKAKPDWLEIKETLEKDNHSWRETE